MSRSDEHKRVIDLFKFPDGEAGELARHFAAAHVHTYVHEMLDAAGIGNVNQLMSSAKDGAGGIGTSTAKKVFDSPLHIELGSLEKVCVACGADFENLKRDLVGGWDWGEYTTAYRDTAARVRDAVAALLRLSDDGQARALNILQTLEQTDAQGCGTTQRRVNEDVRAQIAPAIAALGAIDEDAGQHRRLDGNMRAF